MRKNNSSAQLSASFANKCKQYFYLDGVSMKENTSLGSMGLNPNLNIED